MRPVGGAETPVVESSLSRTILGTSAGFAGRASVGGAEVDVSGGEGGGAATAVPADAAPDQGPASGPVTSAATRMARLSAQIATSNVLVTCWARLLP